MTDILIAIDAAVDNLCACGCGTVIGMDGPSAYFATAECQQRWGAGNATAPNDVYRRPDAADHHPIGPMRWRPDMVVADEMRPLRLTTGGPDAALCPCGGRYNHTVGVDERTGQFVMRLDDGFRYVETTVLREDAREWMSASRDDEIRRRWDSLNRQLGDSRNLDPVDEPWTERSVLADFLDGVAPPLWRSPMTILDETHLWQQNILFVGGPRC